MAKGFQTRAFQSPGFQQESGGGQQGGNFRRRGYRFVPTPDDTKPTKIKRENDLVLIL